MFIRARIALVDRVRQVTDALAEQISA